MSDLVLSPVNHTEEPPFIPLGLLLTDPAGIPHVSLIIGDHTVSLTVNGVSHKNTKDHLQGLKRKKIAALCILLENGNSAIDFNKVSPVFSSMGKVNEESYTCIEPVKTALSLILDTDLSRCSFVYEVLDVLVSMQLVKMIFAIGFGSEDRKNTFTLRRYSREEVNHSIRSYRERTSGKYASSR